MPRLKCDLDGIRTHDSPDENRDALPTEIRSETKKAPANAEA